MLDKELLAAAKLSLLALTAFSLDEEMYCHVLLSYRDYNCLNDLCRLVNINIEGYSRMKYYLPNNDIRYITCSYCLYYLPDCCFDYLALKNTNLYLRN